jgi:hypothetical protein
MNGLGNPSSGCRLSWHEARTQRRQLRSTRLNWIIDRLQALRFEALDLAEQDMRQRDLESLKTPVGSAGWTEPRAKQLDEQAWVKALERDPYLGQVDERYTRAQAARAEAQEPFMELPKPRFFVR